MLFDVRVRSPRRGGARRGARLRHRVVGRGAGARAL